MFLIFSIPVYSFRTFEKKNSATFSLTFWVCKHFVRGSLRHIHMYLCTLNNLTTKKLFNLGYYLTLVFTITVYSFRTYENELCFFILHSWVCIPYVSWNSQQKNLIALSRTSYTKFCLTWTFALLINRIKKKETNGIFFLVFFLQQTTVPQEKCYKIKRFLFFFHFIHFSSS